jgi:hypothetical protein
MSTCPLLRVSRRSPHSLRSHEVAASRSLCTRVDAHTRRWRAVLATLFLKMTGWRALQDLLNAIPDSNDDFALF